MKHSPPHSYSPLDIDELLSIGLNAIYADGVFVFDNLDRHTTDLVAPPPFVKMLVKPKLDIMVICSEGELNYILDSTRPVSLQAGEMALFRQDQIVELNETPGGARIIMIAFAHEFTIGIRAIENVGVSYDTVLYRPSSEALERLMATYAQIRKAISDEENSYRKEIIHAYLRIMMMYLSDIVVKAKENPKGATEKINPRRETIIYNEFTLHVKEEYREHRNVGHYARKMCMTPEHLSRIVKGISGKSVSKWIRDYVVLEAKVLLKSSDISIYQISDILNFPNPSFFTKFFRKNTGMTPGKYREMGP